MMDGFNRTQSVRLYANTMNSGALTSRLNSSYESGILDDEEARQSSRSYMSSSSKGSNPNFTSTCAKTYTSSGGRIDGSSSQMQLTYDMQQMHSSFDLGNDQRYNSYNLTPRQMSDYSYESGQFYDPNHQFKSFHSYTRNQVSQYGTMSCGGMNKMRNCLSVASLDGAKAYSNPGHNFGNSSSNSTLRCHKNKRNSYQKDNGKGQRRRCPAHEADEPKFKINIDKIISGEDKRTTLMIKNIPNKYTGKSLRHEINKCNKNRYDFFYLPIDYTNNCNIGYAFINFIHRAYILDFYYEYNDKKWSMYNSEKVCEITYGRIQGRDKLHRHLKEKKVFKSNNRNVGPLILNLKRPNKQEIKSILDKYSRIRFKEKLHAAPKKREEKDSDNDDPQVTSGQVVLNETTINSTKVEKQESAEPQNLETEKKSIQVFEKRNSQNDTQSKNKLIDKISGERPASDDEDKKESKKGHLPVSTKLKLNFKKISMTSRGNFNSSN